MLAAQAPYGPDDERMWSEGPIALGRRLFRLLPEDSYDRQPLLGAAGRFVLVADVRLDNRDDLARDLGLPFERTRAMCDAAILLECLVRWDEGALDRMVGDFAFALWDSVEQKLLLARDFAGARPLHYHRGRDFFAVASMPKGLHALAEVPFAPDDQAVAELTALLPPDGPRSYFKGIERVEAGCLVAVTRDGVRSRRWWQPRGPGLARARVEDHVEGLRHHLDQAVRARLRGATDAVGSHLSSGWDSGPVTTTAARLLEPSGGKVVAFTAVPRAGYDAPAWRGRLGDEGPLAAATASLHANIEHVKLATGHLSPLDELDRTFHLLEWPVLDSCGWVWTRGIARAARERGLSVMLTGQMGNVSISYAGLEALAELLGTGRLIEFTRRATWLLANGHWRGVAAHALGPFLPAELWQRAHARFKGNRWDVLEYTAIRPERLAGLDLPRLARERHLDLAYRPWSDSVAMRVFMLHRVDFAPYTKGLLGGWGVDHRDPTADRRLVEYCLSIPPEAWLADGRPRGLARRALADRLPPAVLDNRRKGYQAVDWHEGLTAARESGQLMAELERIAACKPAADLLDIPRLKRLVENWPTGGWHKPEVMLPYRTALLRGISVGHFLRKAMGGNE